MQLTRRQAFSTALSTLAALSALPAWPGPAAPPGRGRGGLEAFLAAVRAGDAGRVRAALAADPALARVSDAAGRSALVLARLHGRDEVAGILLATGLEPDLVEAVLGEDWERFEALAEARPEELARAHPVGGTPLYAAALVGSLGCWRLRARGCDPDAAPPGGSGFTPARGALESVRSSWARIGLTDLCGNGADPNARQRGGSSILHGAVLREDEALVRLAVRKGADPDALDDRGRTARALARERGWEAGARLLERPELLPRDNRSSRFARDAGWEPIVRPDLSEVPRELQSRVTTSSHFDLAEVRRLVEADPRLVFSISGDDELAIEASAHMGARPIMRFHLDHGAPLSLPTAVSLGEVEAVEEWLRRDPTLVHERGAHDYPLLWYAAVGGGSAGMAERLASHGAPVDQESMGTTALHWAVRLDDRDLARWLLEHGADPEARGFRWSRDGQTPLGVAAAYGRREAATLLREAGARR